MGPAEPPVPVPAPELPPLGGSSRYRRDPARQGRRFPVPMAAGVNESSKSCDEPGPPARFDDDRIGPAGPRSVRLDRERVIPSRNAISGFTALDDASLRIEAFDEHHMPPLRDEPPKGDIDGDPFTLPSGVRGGQA